MTRLPDEVVNALKSAESVIKDLRVALEDKNEQIDMLRKLNADYVKRINQLEGNLTRNVLFESEG